MSVHQFLRSVWPQQGSFRSIVTMQNGKAPYHHWLPEFPDDSITRILNDSRASGQHAYMALASFAPSEDGKNPRRKVDQAQFLRCLWVDLDVTSLGKEKDYATQEDALSALITFCNASHFPRPTWLVDSGYGLQAYWVADTDLSVTDWQRTAERFFQLCRSHGLLIDPSVARDAARILRLPQSLNVKDPAAPKEVRVLRGDDTITWAQLETVLPLTPQLPAPVPVYETAVNPSFLMSLSAVHTSKKSSQALHNRSLANAGCPQLMFAIKERAKLFEPLWFLWLGLFKLCSDPEYGAYQISVDHKDYSQEGMLTKLAKSDGYAAHCATFDATNPGICGTCPHWGKITSPIQLGTFVEAINTDALTGESQIVEVLPPPPQEHVLAVILESRPAPDNSAGAPFPYMVSGGRTYKILNGAQIQEATKKGIDLISTPDGSLATLAYRGHIQLIGRAYDQADGEEMAHLSVSRGLDVNRPAKLPSAAIASKEALRKAFKQGAILGDAEAAFAQDFIGKAVLEHKEEHVAAPLVHQAGWDGQLGQFVYGRWAIHKTGKISNILPMVSMARVTNALQVRGSMQHWIDMAAYWNRPGCEVMAFTLLSAFGAPLMRFMEMGTNSSLIHLFTPESGYGKSAIQSMICACYGNPRAMMFNPQDTINSMMSMVGTYGSFPICVDEITNHPAQAVSGMVYQFTQGREKLRMNSNSDIRQTSGVWDTSMVTSGNASLIDKLCALKASPEGELMRFLELRPNPLPEGESLSDVMNGINDNYGAVGVKYLYNVVAYQDMVRQVIQETKADLKSRSDMGQEHRFWMALLTSNLAGGRLAKRLGFINYDMEHLTAWAIKTVQDAADAIGARVQKGGNMFGNLLATMQPHTITIPDQGMPIMAKLDPKVLVDIKQRRVCFSINALVEAAQKQQVSVVDMTTRLQDARYRYVGQSEVNLTKCMEGSMPPIVVPAYEYIFTELN
jgi:hypothetical protein